MADALRLVFHLRRDFSDNLGSHRATRRKHLVESLGLKLGDRFREQRVGYTSSATKGLASVFVFKAQQFQSRAVSFLPILSAILVGFVLINQVRSNLRHFLIRQYFRKIFVEISRPLTFHTRIKVHDHAAVFFHLNVNIGAFDEARFFNRNFRLACFPHIDRR